MSVQNMATDSTGELLKETDIKDKETISQSAHAIIKDREIWISPRNALDLFVSLTHEIGHILSEKLSFKQGDILTPDNAKKEAIDLDSREIERAYRHLFSDGQEAETVNTNLMYELARKAVQKLTGGKIDIQNENLIIHYNVPQSEINEIVRNAGGTSTSVVNTDGVETPLNTKSGRNDEIPAIAVQEACLRLLENSISKQYPGFWISQSINTKVFPSELRAAQIVHRAYCSKGWILPSLKDLNTKPSNKP